MSDVDSGTEDDEDDSRGKKKTQDFTGMCFMARDSHDVDSSNDDDPFSDPDEVCPSLVDMKRALFVAKRNLKKQAKMIKKHDTMIDNLNLEVIRLKTINPADDCDSCL